MSFEKKYELSMPVSERDHIQGHDDAAITLVEYGDYQCPHCGQAYPIVKQIQEEFGEKLRFVFRNFPLIEMHQYSFHAAESAEIASEYDKFWEMHDSLFDNQPELADPNLVQIAAQLDIDPEEFAVKLTNDTQAERVKEDLMSGVNSGVNGTPSFYINGYKYEGSWDYETLKSVIEGEM